MHMDNRVRQVKTLFAKELQRRCSAKYQKFPSNEKLARDLCLTSKNHLKVSRETIRKWLKGDTFPDLDCLLHLIDWLQLDMTVIFSNNLNGVDISENLESESNFPYSNDSRIELSEEQINLIIKSLNAQKNLKYRDQKSKY